MHSLSLFTVCTQGKVLPLGVSNLPLNCCNYQRALKNILFTVQPHQLKVLYSVVPPIIIPLENKWEIVLPW